MLKILKNNLIYILLAAVIAGGFWDLTKTFYQQDEWYGLGDILANGSKAIFLHTHPWQIILGQGRIFSDALVYFLIGQFPFNIIPVAIFATSFHTINAILVFILAKMLTQKTLPSFLGAVFFAFNGVSFGAVTWPASGTGTLPATTLVLLAIIFFWQFVQTQKAKWLFFTFLCLYFSLYLKEIGVFLFLFLPLFHLIFFKIPWKKFFRYYWSFLLFCFLTVGLAIIWFQSIPIQKDLFLTGVSPNYLTTISLRAIFYPLTSFSLVYVPAGPSFELAKRFTWSYYPFFPPELYDLVAQSPVLDMMAISLTLILGFILFDLFRKSDVNIKRQVIFFSLFLAGTFLPYIIIGKTGAYLENRYYYLAAAAGGVLLTLASQKLLKIVKISPVSFYTILIFFILIHANVVRGEVKKQEHLAKERINIFTAIETIKPSLSEKSVFYVTGDRNFYVGEGNPLPMQQGMGYSLLVYYFAKEKAPKELISLVDEHFLWEINGQGYKEVEGAGFGYFWDFDKLSVLVKNKKIDIQDITILFYDSKSRKVIDKSKEINFKLKI